MASEGLKRSSCTGLALGGIPAILAAALTSSSDLVSSIISNFNSLQCVTERDSYINELTTGHAHILIELIVSEILW